MLDKLAAADQALGLLEGSVYGLFSALHPQTSKSMEANMASVNHVARARRVWPYLVTAARTPEEFYTYGEISGQIGLHHRTAAWFLGVIQTYCASKGLPPLQALVVNEKSGRPGSGNVGSKRSDKAYKKAVKKVRGHPWPRKAPF